MGPRRTIRKLERDGEKLLERFNEALQRAIENNNDPRSVDRRLEPQKVDYYRKIGRETSHTGEHELLRWADEHIRAYERHWSAFLQQAISVWQTRRTMPQDTRGGHQRGVVENSLQALLQQHLGGNTSDTNAPRPSDDASIARRFRQGLSEMLDQLIPDNVAPPENHPVLRQLKQDFQRELEAVVREGRKDLDDAWWFSERASRHLAQALQESIAVQVQLGEVEVRLAMFPSASERQRLDQKREELWREQRKINDRLERNLEWIGLRTRARRIAKDVGDFVGGLFKEKSRR